MRLLILSDTHVPARGRDLPAAVWDEVLRADAVLHAGDWTHVALLDALESCCENVMGCWGNNDGVELCGLFTVEGVVRVGASIAG